jgi:hypothetical protein
MLVWWIMEQGSKPLIRGVEALQRRICGDEAVDDDEQEEGLQLEEARGLLSEASGSQEAGRITAVEVPGSKQAPMEV